MTDATDSSSVDCSLETRSSEILSTSALESRLQQLRQQSSTLSSELTRKLATSQSGQSLLHIGPSLSTLPPDLTTLLEALSPLLAQVEQSEASHREELDRLLKMDSLVRSALWKRQFALQCAEIYRDLCAAEQIVKTDQNETNIQLHQDPQIPGEELYRISSLERAAYISLYLLQELQSSSTQVSTITGTGSSSLTSTSLSTTLTDTANHTHQEKHSNNVESLPSVTSDNSGLHGVIIEKSRFLMKLAPRMRRLESDTAKCLVRRLEELLALVRNNIMEEDREDLGRRVDEGADQKQHQFKRRKERNEELLLMIGHCLRGLALLGKGADAESAFARIAIMPILRSKLSIGKLDEGGSRGECAGLFFVLDDIANTVASMYGSIVRSSEGMFTYDTVDSDKATFRMEVDLVTCGVWVPLATALMADPGIEMAIFSPGIANVLQANYTALETFLSELASNLLQSPCQDQSSQSEEKSNHEHSELGDFSHLYYQPTITLDSIVRAQSRIYAHPTTVEFSKKWNLPIYYQLRFAEFCKRLDKALESVSTIGWEADVFTGEVSDAKAIKEQVGFELPIFVELYDVLVSMWKDNIFLRPLTHRFLRGAVQLVGRVLAFIKEGLDGNMQFGGNSSAPEEEEKNLETVVGLPAYYWHERVEDLAIVSWELTILETCMTHEYFEIVAARVSPTDNDCKQNGVISRPESEEIRSLVSEVLLESSQDVSPLILHSWNKLIVENLISQCSTPLSAVKGVAATYRMTNRPPPTQASPFVATILRPLRDFDATFSSRIPPQIGDGWKRSIIEVVADKYASAVEELIATVKRTEDALKSRKTRRMMAGGMSDGEKVKLQLFLDHKEFKMQVENLGLVANSVAGLVKFKDLTQEAESIFDQSLES